MTKTASEGKIFAYKDEKGNEIQMSSILILGKNDDGTRYYQIDKPTEIEIGQTENE